MYILMSFYERYMYFDIRAYYGKWLRNIIYMLNRCYCLFSWLTFFHFQLQKLSSSRPLAGNNSSPDTFLPQSFLDKHNLELLCAPVSFMSGTDVSGQSGIITLTSPALLKIKPRSLVIYMKHSTASKTDSDYKVSAS